MKYLWVVEMDCNGRWEPTVGVALTREAGRVELWRWKNNYTMSAVRLTRYSAVPVKRGKR